MSTTKKENFDLSQEARERIKNEAFYKTPDGNNALDLTLTREIIMDALSQQNSYLRSEVEKMKKDSTVKMNRNGSNCCSTCGLQEECGCDMYNQALENILKMMSDSHEL